MSVLSEKLSALLEDRGMTVAQVARLCAIERPTVYQYFTGKRAINNPEHLRMIAGVLCLTPQEQLEVKDAFTMERIGYSLYTQRKKVQEFLRYIPAMDAPEWMTFDGQSCRLPEEPVLGGELAVCQAAFAMISQAYEREEELYLLLQPEHRNLLGSLRFLVNSPRQASVTHIVCLESDAKQGRIENLNRAQHLLSLSAMVRRYRPLYYYGKAAERFGAISVLPGLIVGKNAAMEVTADGHVALLHTNPQVVEMFQKGFQRMARQCKPILLYKSDLEAELSWGMDHLQGDVYSESLEMPSDLCTSAFWTEDLIRRYMNRAVPNRERLIQSFAVYSQRHHGAKRTGRVVQILNPHYVKDFLKTGVFHEYPPQFLEGPLEPRDRRYLVEQVLAACREGWLQIHILPENATILNQRTEICVQNHQVFSIQLWSEGRFMLFTFLEPGIVASVTDYLESLLEEGNTLGHEASMNQLQQWLQEYL